jgi:hypothetical protein
MISIGTSRGANAEVQVHWLYIIRYEIKAIILTCMCHQHRYRKAPYYLVRLCIVVYSILKFRRHSLNVMLQIQIKTVLKCLLR